MLHAGVIFVGGFSYADVLDSAKGWSCACCHHHYHHQHNNHLDILLVRFCDSASAYRPNAVSVQARHIQPGCVQRLSADGLARLGARH